MTIFEKGDIVETNSYKSSGATYYGRITNGWFEEGVQYYLVHFPPLPMEIIVKEEILRKVTDEEAMLLILNGIL